MAFKIIEKEINSLRSKSKIFLKNYNSLNKILEEIHTDKNKIKKDSLKLINILFKSSKRKILFEFTQTKESSNSVARRIKVGTNVAGLGYISTSYGNNLENFKRGWNGDKLFDLCKNKRFRELLIKSIKGKKNKTIINFILNVTTVQEEIKENIKVEEKIFISINSGVVFSKEDRAGYGESYIIIDFEDEISLEDNHLKEISSSNFSFSCWDLIKFYYLMNRKEKIINILKDKIKQYKQVNKEVTRQKTKIQSWLNPYKALENL